VDRVDGPGAGDITGDLDNLGGHHVSLLLWIRGYSCISWFQTGTVLILGKPRSFGKKALSPHQVTWR
jgi:hypothetical protein